LARTGRWLLLARISTLERATGLDRLTILASSRALFTPGFPRTELC
jgi:hypothetical protein